MRAASLCVLVSIMVLMTEGFGGGGPQGGPFGGAGPFGGQQGGNSNPPGPPTRCIYAQSFSESTPTNCPSLCDEIKPALLKAFNDGDTSDFADLLSDESYIGCTNTNNDTQCNDKATTIGSYQFFSSLLSNYDVEYTDVKQGTNFVQANSRTIVTTLNGGCTYQIIGASRFYCDANGLIIEDTEVNNEQVFGAAFAQATNGGTCSGGSPPFGKGPGGPKGLMDIWNPIRDNGVPGDDMSTLVVSEQTLYIIAGFVAVLLMVNIICLGYQNNYCVCKKKRKYSKVAFTSDEDI